MIRKDRSKDGTATHLARLRAGRKWNRSRLTQTLVRTAAVVGGRIFAQPLSQMRCIEEDQLVQTFVPNRSHPAFGLGVGIGGTKGRANKMHTGRTEPAIEGSYELAIAGVDQEMDSRLPFLHLPDHVACLLRDRLPIRRARATRPLHTSAGQLDEEQDLHGLQEKRLDREAIAGADLGFVMLQQLSPTGRWPSLWRGGNAGPFQDSGQRLLAAVIA